MVCILYIPSTTSTQVQQQVTSTVTNNHQLCDHKSDTKSKTLFSSSHSMIHGSKSQRTIGTAPSSNENSVCTSFAPLAKAWMHALQSIGWHADFHSKCFFFFQYWIIYIGTISSSDCVPGPATPNYQRLSLYSMFIVQYVHLSVCLSININILHTYLLLIYACIYISSGIIHSKNNFSNTEQPHHNYLGLCASPNPNYRCWCLYSTTGLSTRPGGLLDLVLLPLPPMAELS